MPDFMPHYLFNAHAYALYTICGQMCWQIYTDGKINMVSAAAGKDQGCINSTFPAPRSWDETLWPTWFQSPSGKIFPSFLCETNWDELYLKWCKITFNFKCKISKASHLRGNFCYMSLKFADQFQSTNMFLLFLQTLILVDIRFSIWKPGVLFLFFFSSQLNSNVQFILAKCYTLNWWTSWQNKHLSHCIYLFFFFLTKAPGKGLC